MQNRNDLIIKTLFPPSVPLVYIYVWYHILIYVLCLIFILTDSVILLFPVMSLYMQARKVYAKYYHSHPYVI